MANNDRDLIFKEIVETETKYLGSLTHLNSIYISPMQNKKFFEFKKDMTETVKNLSIILNFNGFLLKSLNDKEAKENIGSIFCRIMYVVCLFACFCICCVTGCCFDMRVFDTDIILSSLLPNFESGENNVRKKNRDRCQYDKTEKKKWQNGGLNLAPKMNQCHTKMS